jgi:hypothetical protein
MWAVGSLVLRAVQVRDGLPILFETHSEHLREEGVQYSVNSLTFHLSLTFAA